MVSLWAGRGDRSLYVAVNLQVVVARDFSLRLLMLTPDMPNLVNGLVRRSSRGNPKQRLELDLQDLQ